MVLVSNRRHNTFGSARLSSLKSTTPVDMTETPASSSLSVRDSQSSSKVIAQSYEAIQDDHSFQAPYKALNPAKSHPVRKIG
jgi:hypothetical protein